MVKGRDGCGCAGFGACVHAGQLAAWPRKKALTFAFLLCDRFPVVVLL